MTTSKPRYAQIEKEALAITWACEMFSSYVLGKQILLETDHKPLLMYKHLDNLLPRILRFQLRLMRFDYGISHVPGKYLYVADALSRSNAIHNSNEAEIKTVSGGEMFYTDSCFSSAGISREDLSRTSI